MKSLSALTALTALTGLLALSACGLLDDTDETVAWSANKLYAESRDALDDGNYAKAVKYFEKLEARYPYGSYAQQAQLDVAYAHFKSGEPTEAVAACDRFIKLHPNHPNVDYAFYLKGLTNFNENTGLFGGFTKEDPAERDPKAARDSFDAFKELATRFPNSKYTPDAIYRMKYLVNSLAHHEIIVARWYMRLGAYVAANNRAQFAIKTYPETPSTEEALAMMVGAYDGMKIDALREDAKRVLQSTYPKSSFLQRGSPGHWKTLWN